MLPSVPPAHQPSGLELLADASPRQPVAPQPGRLSEMLGVLRRHPWLILGSTLALTALAFWATLHMVRVYEATTVLRIDEKQSSIPEMLRTLGAGTEVSTELEELRSRSLAEEVTRKLSLQLRVVKPRDVRRESLFGNIQISDSAPPRAYQLSWGGGGRFVLRERDSSRVLATLQPTDTVRLPGVSFTMAPGAGEHGRIEFVVQSVVGAASGVGDNLTVRQVNREAKMVEVHYRDVDPDLAWRVPTALVQEFIRRRQEVRTAQARSSAAFLRKQLDTLTAQLAVSEDEVRAYRERHRVVSPEAEASSQINRMVQTQAERGLIEAERQALAQLLQSLEVKDQARKGDEPSPYAEVLAFPTLLRNDAATQLLQSLTAVQDQRRSLLSRRTPEDPDVVALAERERELERQIRSMGSTYLEGLTNQVSSLDTSLQSLNRELTRLPERELHVARLERRPRVLEDIAAMLQTRLKEAEIAAAESDPSVRVVDAAIAPDDPVSPNPTRNLLLGVVLGLIMGVGGAFVREHLDPSVHTRNDIVAATGLPVMGFIPRISSCEQSVIAQACRPEAVSRRRLRAEIKRIEPGPEPARPPVTRRPTFTFFPVEDEPAEIPAGPPAGAPPVAPAALAGIQWELTQEGMAAAESYSILQTNLSFARADGPVKTVVFTSALPGEGKTTTTVNLALALAQRGLKTLLIDADIRRGRVHGIFNQAREGGLTEILTGKRQVAETLRSVELENKRVLHYIAVGGPVVSPTGLLDSEGMRGLLQEVRAQYDSVIIDSSPINIVTDAALLSLLADGVVIVARAGVTEAGALEHALDQLRRVRAPVLGVVLNDIDFAKDVSYDRAYRYHAGQDEYLSTPT